jgi:myosin heavy subunit
MTIEQILALLVAKFSGVRKDGLTQMARNISLLATTDTEVQALIDKLEVNKVTEIVKDYRTEVDKEVTTATKTHETNLRKKYDLKDKAEPDPEPGKGKTPEGDDTPAWAKSLLETNQKLTERLNGLEAGKVKQTRLQTLEEKLKDVPAAYKADKLKDFNRMGFDTDEAFTEYLTETEAGITALNQELADKGLSGQTKPIFGQPGKDGVSSAAAQFIESKTKPETGLGGKEV